MKQLHAFLLTALILIPAAFLAFTPQPADASRGATVEIKEGICIMPGFDAVGDLVGFGGVGGETVIVQLEHRLIMQCHGQDILNDSGMTRSIEGIECVMFPPNGGVAITTHSKAVVTQNGNAKLTCSCRLGADGYCQH